MNISPKTMNFVCQMARRDRCTTPWAQLSYASEGKASCQRGREWPLFSAPGEKKLLISSYARSIRHYVTVSFYSCAFLGFSYIPKFIAWGMKTTQMVPASHIAAWPKLLLRIIVTGMLKRMNVIPMKTETLFSNEVFRMWSVELHFIYPPMLYCINRSKRKKGLEIQNQFCSWCDSNKILRDF